MRLFVMEAEMDKSFATRGCGKEEIFVSSESALWDMGIFDRHEIWVREGYGYLPCCLTREILPNGWKGIFCVLFELYLICSSSCYTLELSKE